MASTYMTSAKIGLATIATACLAMGAFAAETVVPPKPAGTAQVAVPEEPVTTTASFGDWVLRCQRQSETPKAFRVCEVAQTIQVQGQQGPVAQIAIGRLSSDQPLGLTIVLPNNVSFPSTVHMTTKDKDRELAWTRCAPGGCFASATLPDDVLKVWRTATDAGKIVFKDAGAHDIALPFSFRGLSQALDALAKERV